VEATNGDCFDKPSHWTVAQNLEALKVGDPFDETTDLGPLATADGLSSLDLDVQKTIRAGARLLTGGRRLERPGNFYAPTVLADISTESPGYREEMFGPVACLFRAEDVDDGKRQPLRAGCKRLDQ
jgi:succinate-semialdehyde dehydrogenase/glutarate-semialdehyde dehydrogenase